MKQHITPEQLQELTEERAKENQAPCPGVWANEKTPEECKTLREVLEEWLLLELLDNDPLPEPVDRIKIYQ